MAEKLAAEVISSSLREVAQINLKEEVVSVAAHEVGEAKKENSAVKFVPDFAIELESVRGAAEVLVQEELLNVVAKDLAAEVITNSLRELESTSLVEDIASEAEKNIPQITCELTGNVIELKSEVPEVHRSVKEILSDVTRPSEDAKLSNKAHECTVEWETVSEVQPEIAMEFENVTAVTEICLQEEVVSVVAHEDGEGKKKNSAVKLVPDFAIELESVRGATEVQENSVIELESQDPEVHESVKESFSDVPSEVDKLSDHTHECKLESESVSAAQPEIAVELKNVTPVTEINLQPEVVSAVAHKVGDARKKNNAVKLVPDFGIELTSVRGANEVLIQEELINVIAEDLAAEVITSSLRELESALVEEIASEAETIQAVVCELTDSVIELESEDPVVDEVSETSVDILVDKLGGTVEGSKCMLEWETVGVIEPEIAVEFEGVAAVTEIPVQDEIISGVVHNLSAEVKPDLSFEPQSVTAAPPLELGNATSTRESVSTKKESTFFPDCSLQMENGSDVSTISNEAAAAEVKTSCTLWPESSLDLKSVSEVV